jgi:hypothetical protein
MKKLIFCFVVAVALCPVFYTAAQDKPTSSTPKEPTTAELKAQLARANATIMQLQAQMLELNINLQIAQKAVLGPAVEQSRQQIQQQVQQTSEAATKAEAEAKKK